MTNGTDGVDVTVSLTADHREMLELIERALHEVDSVRRRDLTDTAIAEVMRHAVAEEMYVYPAIVKHVEGGSAAVEHDKEEHQEIVEVMKQLEQTDVATPNFTELLEIFKSQIAHHGKSEEAEQFPRLRAAIPKDRLFELGAQVETAKKLAPTRPHPSAPHSELFHKTIGAGVGMVDRLRDKLTGRQTSA